MADDGLCSATVGPGGCPGSRCGPDRGPTGGSPCAPSWSASRATAPADAGLLGRAPPARSPLDPPDTAAGRELAQIGAALPWFAHDALIHYLSPRGLEQYTGGAWGTRDVSQGPVGLLLTLGAYDGAARPAAAILGAQNARGDWPQAFDFLPRHRRPGQQDAHGDVVYWPLLALGDYLRHRRPRARRVASCVGMAGRPTVTVRTTLTERSIDGAR